MSWWSLAWLRITDKCSQGFNKVRCYTAFSSVPLHGLTPRCITILFMAPATIGALEHTAAFFMLLHTLHWFALREYFVAVALFHATADSHLGWRHIIRSDSIDQKRSEAYCSCLGAMIAMTSHKSVHCVALGMILFTTAMTSHHWWCLAIGRTSASQECKARGTTSSGLVFLERRLRNFAGGFICLFWISLGFAHIQLLRGVCLASDGGASYAIYPPLVAMGAGRCLFALLCVWNADNGSLLAGRSHAWTKKDLRRLQRAAVHGISPLKTWAGIVGGILIGIATAFLLADFLRRTEHGHSHVCNTRLFYAALPCWPSAAWVLLGTVLSFLAVAGDLVESALKRAGRIKDSGRIFPGHGGCLDRMDSLLLSIPAFYHAYRALGFFWEGGGGQGP